MWVGLVFRDKPINQTNAPSIGGAHRLHNDLMGIGLPEINYINSRHVKKRAWLLKAAPPP